MTIPGIGEGVQQLHGDFSAHIRNHRIPFRTAGPPRHSAPRYSLVWWNWQCSATRSIHQEDRPVRGDICEDRLHILRAAASINRFLWETQRPRLYLDRPRVRWTEGQSTRWLPHERGPRGPDPRKDLASNHRMPTGRPGTCSDWQAAAFSTTVGAAGKLIHLTTSTLGRSELLEIVTCDHRRQRRSVMRPSLCWRGVEVRR